MPPTAAFPALRHPNFRYFIIGQCVSLCVTWMQTVALGWLVLTLTDSAFAVGLVSALGSLPVLLFTLQGGAMADRVNIVDVRILVTAILIQREVGGNLAEVLDNLANVIRVRFTIRRQLRVYTAQGRFSGYVLAVLPIAVGAAIYSLNPPYIRLLFTDPLGKLMLLTAVIFQIIGFLWIRKIIDIEI